MTGETLRLAVEDVACSRAGRRVFAGLSFGLAGGESLAVTGRNGSGKSTLLAALAGLLAPAKGTIALSGTEGRSRSESVHHLAHRDGLKPSLTAAENLRFAAACLGAPDQPAEAALARLGLARAAHLPAAYLSAGQRRRLGLARLLVARRPVWLLDEPTTALDADGQALLADIVTEHLRAGGMVVAATHGPLPGPESRELRLGQAAGPDGRAA